jgi:hypothetical protein
MACSIRTPEHPTWRSTPPTIAEARHQARYNDGRWLVRLSLAEGRTTHAVRVMTVGTLARLEARGVDWMACDEDRQPMSWPKEVGGE